MGLSSAAPAPSIPESDTAARCNGRTAAARALQRAEPRVLPKAKARARQFAAPVATNLAREAYGDIRRLGLSPAVARVLRCIVSLLPGDGQAVMTYRQIERRTRVPRRTVIAAVRFAEHLGVLAVVRTKMGRYPSDTWNRPNAYEWVGGRPGKVPRGAFRLFVNHPPPTGCNVAPGGSPNVAPLYVPGTGGTERTAERPRKADTGERDPRSDDRLGAPAPRPAVTVDVACPRCARPLAGASFCRGCGLGFSDSAEG